MDSLEKLLALGAHTTISLSRHDGEEKPVVLQAHIYEVRHKHGVVKDGRHFTCEGTSLADVIAQAAAIVG